MRLALAGSSEVLARDFVVGDVPQDAAWLTGRGLADGLQHREPDRPRSASLEVARVGQGEVHATAEFTQASPRDDPVAMVAGKPVRTWR
jgi:hypothetical protein